MLDVHLTGRRLSAFIDAELVADEADRWREHLLRCSACTQAVAVERTVRERVRHSCVPQPSNEFMLRVAALAGDSDPHCAASSAMDLKRSRRVIPARRSAVAMVVVTTTTAAAVVVVGLATFGTLPLPAATPATPVAEATPGPAVPPMSPVLVRAGFGTMITYSLSPYRESGSGAR